MRVYSDGNPSPFVTGYVRSAAPVFDHAQGESDAIFSGLKLELSDGRTIAFIDVGEVETIAQAMQSVMALSEAGR